ncbi:mas-related G-protein coupled receptor member G [Pteropus alecto]|uniref:Mas-related G-protein coupled receptor member G n=1 Tax=Pteropus alecto TaxID=9402 RepID=L5KPI2_PTEAL|nr:mas-related G-protein coupled receptor member G [Pteropus alecto]ELK13222.1 Mas-related G-protein coupled receptor member G [Pteropus alecto]
MFASVAFYLGLAVSLGGLLGNGLVLWHLGFRIQRGPFSVYVLHLAAADFLFLCCHVAFSTVQAALGSRDTLHFAVTFVGFAAGLWLLAALSLERCLSEVFPACYWSCRPRWASGVVCGLLWVLTPPAVLLPAHTCSLLYAASRLLTCLRYHAASVAWLLCLACGACGAGLLLFLWVGCCSQRPRPRFYGAVLGPVLLLYFCGLPFILYWSLRPLFDQLLPVFPPLATLLACVHASSKPLIYFSAGRRPGKREPLQAVLQRALGDAAQLRAGGPSLPMGAHRPPLARPLQDHVGG